MEPLASLTALSDLRMSVYSNGDATLTLQLSQLTALSNLQASIVIKSLLWLRWRRDAWNAKPSAAAAKAGSSCSSRGM
jgi:hypothetical protein